MPDEQPRDPFSRGLARWRSASQGAKKVVIGALVAVVVALVWVVSIVADREEDRPGSPDVYERIERETSCRELQETFDRAADNNDRADPGTAEFDWTLGYMKAADERMQDLGCYDD